MKSAGVVQWQNASFPSSIRGFDSRHPLQMDNKAFARLACEDLGKTKIPELLEFMGYK
jgi:hypothetical protein